MRRTGLVFRTSITLTATGSGTLTYTVVANPSHGTLSGTAPSLTYTPNASYTGADSVTASHAGNTNFSAATPVMRTFTTQ